jgi:S1-C subfamily serine protease
VEAIRNGRLFSTKVRIAVRPEEKSIGKIKVQGERETYPDKSSDDIRIWRGVQVSDITPEINMQYNLKADTGVIVVDVQSNSPADESGLRKGDIIYEINRRTIRDVQDYNRVVKNLSGDVLIGTYRGYVVIRDR